MVGKLFEIAYFHRIIKGEDLVILFHLNDMVEPNIGNSRTAYKIHQRIPSISFTAQEITGANPIYVFFCKVVRLAEPLHFFCKCHSFLHFYKYQQQPFLCELGSTNYIIHHFTNFVNEKNIAKKYAPSMTRRCFFGKQTF